MAITDIHEFVKVAPNDLIRSDDLNNVQRQLRNSVRAHRHTRAAAAPPNDAAAADLALQITTDELADQAVTAAKLADGAVTAGKLADGAVTGPRLADLAVGTTKLQNGAISAEKLQANAVDRANIRDGAVNLPKLALQEVKAGSQGLGAVSSPGDQATVDVQAGVTTALSSVFFPVVTLPAVSGGTAADVEAVVVYRRTPSTPGTGVGVRLRLRNSGSSSATVSWRVLTFAPFEAPSYPYGFGFRAAIGGELV